MSNTTPFTLYDLRKPHAKINVGGRWIKFKETYTTEGVFYAPSYISPLKQRRGWRVRMKLTVPATDRHFCGSEQSLEELLTEAWRFVLNTLESTTLRQPGTKKKDNTDLDTGAIGVRLNWNKGSKDKITMMLRVGQSLFHEKAFQVTFYSTGSDAIDRDFFNERYKAAVAARKYYEFLRLKHYRLLKPITPSTVIPEEFFPKTLPVPDLYDRMLKALAEREAIGGN